MKKDPLIFIKHILENIGAIEKSIKDLSKTKFEKDKDIKDATVRRIEIIGEAVKNIPMAFRKKYPEIEWKKIAGTRDIMIHAYFDVDFNAIWDIIKKDIPYLKKKIIEILKK